jgi:formate hydrogenlyase subunit 6/NADH:ubiquinone oxidoreductase subunit I
MPYKNQKVETAQALTLEWILQVKNYKLTLDKARCVGCEVCSLACPKNAITVTRQPKEAGSSTKRAKVDIDLAKCNFCGICDITCPYGAIKVTSNGEHDLNVISKDSFPQLIRDIKVDTKIDVCPIKGTLKVTNGKVEVDESTCTYCGACKLVCPVEGALTLKRTKILHTPVHSGTWNKSLERLTSPMDAAKELKATCGMNVKKIVAKRFVSEEDIR